MFSYILGAVPVTLISGALFWVQDKRAKIVMAKNLRHAKILAGLED